MKFQRIGTGPVFARMAIFSMLLLVGAAAYAMDEDIPPPADSDIPAAKSSIGGSKAPGGDAALKEDESIPAPSLGDESLPEPSVDRGQEKAKNQVNKTPEDDEIFLPTPNVNDNVYYAPVGTPAPRVSADDLDWRMLNTNRPAFSLYLGLGFKSYPNNFVKQTFTTGYFAKDFQAESAADLRAKVRKSLEGELETEQRQQTQEEILLAFVESNPIDVPPSLVQRQLEYILGDVLNMLRKQKFGDTLIAEYVQKHRKDFEARAEREVRLALLLPKVVEEEKITVGEQDFKAHFDQIVAQSGQKIDAVEKFYLDNTQRKAELAHELERKKALQIMVDSAKAK